MSRINIPEKDRKRVVIIGAGFAGLTLAESLKNGPFQIVLLDQNNYHQFQPLFYQVAMSGLEPSAISFPIRRAFQNNKNVFIRICTVSYIHTEEKYVESNLGKVNYDYLVLAMGAKNYFYNNVNFEKYSLPLKSISEAIYLRNRILEDFERALLETDPTIRKSYLDLVIVGAGPTGVELAGAMAELKKHILPKDYPELNLNDMDIHLIQSGAKVLDAMSEKSSQRSLSDLQNLGIKIHLNTRVTDILEDKVILSNGLVLNSKKVIWAAGITAASLPGLHNEAYHKSNRIITNEFLQVQNHQDIYAIGDLAFVQSENGHPQVAQVAMQQAKLLSENLLAIHDNKMLRPFRYLDKGTMATIGRHKAVVDVGKLFFSGFIAWFMWLTVHIYFLIGIKNRIIVMFNWIWSYLFFDQGLRLILKPKDKK